MLLGGAYSAPCSVSLANSSAGMATSPPVEHGMAVTGIDEEPAPSFALAQNEQQQQEAKARFSADTVAWLPVCSEAGGLSFRI